MNLIYFLVIMNYDWIVIILTYSQRMQASQSKKSAIIYIGYLIRRQVTKAIY